MFCLESIGCVAKTTWKLTCFSPFNQQAQVLLRPPPRWIHVPPSPERSHPDIFHGRDCCSVVCVSANHTGSLYNLCPTIEGHRYTGLDAANVAQPLWLRVGDDSTKPADQIPVTTVIFHALRVWVPAAIWAAYNGATPLNCRTQRNNTQAKNRWSWTSFLSLNISSFSFIIFFFF